MSGWALDVVALGAGPRGGGDVQALLSDVVGARVVVVVLLDLLVDPGDVLGHVGVDAGQPRVRALDAPRHDAAHVPARRVVRVFAQEGPAGVALESTHRRR